MTATQSRPAVWILLFFAFMMGVQPANAADQEFKTTAEAVRSLIEASRYENGDLRTAHKKLAIYPLADDSIEQRERDVFDDILFTEIHLLGRLLPIYPARNAIPQYPPGAPHSSIVVFRDPDDMKIAEYASVIPGIVAAVNSVKGELTDKECQFFSQQDPKSSDDLLVVYVFVGRNHDDPSICLHSGIAKAFGVVRNLDRSFPYPDRYLTELIAMRLIGLCAEKHGQERVACALSKSKSFK